MNLGVTEPATEDIVDTVLTLYRQAGVRNFAFYHDPHCQPATLPEWFRSRGLHLRGGWERIYRDNRPLTSAVIEPPPRSRVEKVTPTTASAWAAFIDNMYGLPTTPWLLSLVGRPGWYHYLLRRDERIVAVRTMYVDGAGMAWLGIDAPVPGVMAPSYDLDINCARRLCKMGSVQESSISWRISKPQPLR
jgi:hypothetical protein